jgi:hypothetical protein
MAQDSQLFRSSLSNNQSFLRRWETRATTKKVELPGNQDRPPKPWAISSRPT